MNLTVVLPVLNEESVLDRHVREVYGRLERDFPYLDWLLVLVDNGSDDATPEIAGRLRQVLSRLRYERLEEKGKGRAIRHGWQRYPADVNVFMDADLATDLDALVPLVGAVQAGHHLATGSRVHPDSIVNRSRLRRIVSFGFRTLLSSRFPMRIKDAPCGFKAVSGHVVREIVPEVRNLHWFFDTELLVRTQHQGLSIKDIPVYWLERDLNQRKSRVGILQVSWQYLREVERLRRELRVARFK